ncbi:hypothetical protein [Halogranum rubrum]|uniref:Uncharacterized protein n=1 Tax=Halogranum salarium B-1 TaxID=1210908 RepID=J3ESI8_9EURY|nr:hypothetical protein [Halogranum salarium]EJN56887.1 hypothetical protein HSB1_47040 [Halogranum salarium B-1]
MIFLANRDGLRNKRLHRRIKNRLQSDSAFSAVQLRVATHRELGPYRVVAETDPRTLFDDSNYPTQEARLEVGFDVEGATDYDYYWFNWVEPGRSLLLGWHQDDDHPEHGPVHLQVNDSSTAVDRKPAEFIDEHPMAVVEARLAQLPDTLDALRWQDGSVVGFE